MRYENDSGTAVQTNTRGGSSINATTDGNTQGAGAQQLNDSSATPPSNP
jgi:hypothetical protein